MDIDEFLLKLIDDDYELKNIAFRENEIQFINIINNFQSKLAIAISSSFFNENIYFYSDFQNINHIQSIISLPIFHDSSNVILILINENKTSDEFLFIDESDSLLHNLDYFQDIGQETALNLINTIKNYKNSDNASYLMLDSIFKKENIKNLEENISKKNLNNKRKAIAKIYSQIKSSQDNNEPTKNKIIQNEINDQMLNLREKKARMELKKNNNDSNIIADLSYPKKRQNPENLLKKKGKPLIKGNVQFRNLGKLADLENISTKNNDNTLLIATSKNNTSKLVYYNHDVKEFLGEMYIEISNINEDVLMDYLYEYLNSSNGIDELLYFSNGFNYINAKFLKKVKIPVPSIKIQKEIVKASKDAREFFKTVDLLKNEFHSNILDYKYISQSINELKGDIRFDSETYEVTKLSRSWRHAYQGLIWPLAISYLVATKGGFEIVEKKENYLKLFEFVAAFNTIILLSGLPKDVYLNNFDTIWGAKDYKPYKSMTFGSWIVLSNKIAEVYNKNNFTTKLDEDLFEKIKSNNLLNLLDGSKNYRNEEVHGAFTNVYEADKTIEILDNYLEDIFDVLDIYLNYKLIYTTGNLKQNNDGSYIHEVILLNGPCAQPIYDKINFETELNPESLYLYNPKNNKKLLIRDTLMKFKPIDNNKKHWALFVYYHCNIGENKAKYKCFQSKEKDFVKNISSFKLDILL